MTASHPVVGLRPRVGHAPSAMCSSQVTGLASPLSCQRPRWGFAPLLGLPPGPLGLFSRPRRYCPVAWAPVPGRGKLPGVDISPVARVGVPSHPPMVQAGLVNPSWCHPPVHWAVAPGPSGTAQWHVLSSRADASSRISTSAQPHGLVPPRTRQWPRRASSTNQPQLVPPPGSLLSSSVHLLSFFLSLSSRSGWRE